VRSGADGDPFRVVKTVKLGGAAASGSGKERAPASAIASETAGSSGLGI